MSLIKVAIVNIIIITITNKYQVNRGLLTTFTELKGTS